MCPDPDPDPDPGAIHIVHLLTGLMHLALSRTSDRCIVMMVMEDGHEDTDPPQRLSRPFFTRVMMYEDGPAPPPRGVDTGGGVSGHGMPEGHPRGGPSGVDEPCASRGTSSGPRSGLWSGDALKGHKVEIFQVRQ